MAEKKFSFRYLRYRHSVEYFFIPSMIYGGETTFFEIIDLYTYFQEIIESK